MNLNKIVSQSLDLEEGTVDKVLEEYSKAILLHLVFAGPTDTIFGRLSYLDGKISIVSQNEATIKAVKSSQTREALLESISEVVLENQND